MTSLLVGSKSFSFKHKNFQKQTTSFFAEDFPFHVCLWLTTIRVTVVHPFPKPLQVTLNYIAQKTAIHTLKQIWPLSPRPLPYCCRKNYSVSSQPWPLPYRCQSHSGQEAVWAVGSFLLFFFHLQSSISLKHHHSTSKRIPRLQEAPHQLSLCLVHISSFENTSQI